MRNKIIILASILLSIIFALSPAVFANTTDQDDYPDTKRTIEIIVPFGAGGGTDIVTRAILKYIDVGSPLAVLNITGASGSIGTMEAYHARPDGYKLFSWSPQSMLAFYISGTIPEPAWEEMEALGVVVKDPNVVVVPKNSQFNSFEELVEYAKENPGILSWGAIGTGGTTHMSSVSIWDAAGIELNYVPFDGAAKSRAAVLGEHVDAVLMQVSEGADMIKSGELKGILVTGNERSPYLPDIPSVTELGYDNAVFEYQRGFFAPPDTPNHIVKFWEAEFKRITEDPEFVNEIENIFYYEVSFINSEEVQEMLVKAQPLYERIINELIK